MPALFLLKKLGMYRPNRRFRLFLRNDGGEAVRALRGGRNGDALPGQGGAQPRFNRRRALAAHGIVPKTIVKDVRDLLQFSGAESRMKKGNVKMTDKERLAEIARLEKQMKDAAKMLEFEIAAELRDRIILLKGQR